MRGVVGLFNREFWRGGERRRIVEGGLKNDARSGKEWIESWQMSKETIGNFNLLRIKAASISSLVVFQKNYRDSQVLSDYCVLYFISFRTAAE